MTQEHKTAEVIPFSRFLEARERKTDPKGYEARKMYEAIGQQARASEAAKPLLIGDTEPIDPDFDDDIPVFDRGLLWGLKDEKPGPLTLFFLTQADPGDEI